MGVSFIYAQHAQLISGLLILGLVHFTHFACIQWMPHKYYKDNFKIAEFPVVNLL